MPKISGISVALIIIKDTFPRTSYYLNSMENPTMEISVIYKPDKIYDD